MLFNQLPTKCCALLCLTLLLGCGSDPATTLNSNSASTEGAFPLKSCAFDAPLAVWINDFRKVCPRSSLALSENEKSLSRYYHALKALRYSNNTIETDFVTLDSWLRQIPNLTSRDQECAKTIICGENP